MFYHKLSLKQNIIISLKILNETTKKSTKTNPWIPPYHLKSTIPQKRENVILKIKIQKTPENTSSLSPKKAAHTWHDGAYLFLYQRLFHSFNDIEPSWSTSEPDATSCRTCIASDTFVFRSSGDSMRLITSDWSISSNIPVTFAVYWFGASRSTRGYRCSPNIC